MVLDRGYCHRVVWSSVSTVMTRKRQRYGVGANGEKIRKGWHYEPHTAYRWPLSKRRSYAQGLAARLNAEAP